MKKRGKLILTMLCLVLLQMTGLGILTSEAAGKGKYLRPGNFFTTRLAVVRWKSVEQHRIPVL